MTPQRLRIAHEDADEYTGDLRKTAISKDGDLKRLNGGSRTHLENSNATTPQSRLEDTDDDAGDLRMTAISEDGDLGHLNMYSF